MNKSHAQAEVMDALPKLIKLNPMVVKEVFNRLMGSHGEYRMTKSSLRHEQQQKEGERMFHVWLGVTFVGSFSF